MNIKKMSNSVAAVGIFLGVLAVLMTFSLHKVDEGECCPTGLGKG